MPICRLQNTMPIRSLIISFLDANENRLEPEGYGYDSNVEKFKNMLDE